MKTGRTELKLYRLEYKLNVISGAHFTLKLKIWPVSWMGAKDMRIMGQNKLLYYSWHIKRHEQVFVGILCPPKFCKGNVEEPNRHYTHRRFSLYQRRFIDVTSFLKTACYKLRTGTGKERACQCVLGVLREIHRNAKTHGGVSQQNFYLFCSFIYSRNLE